MHIAVFNHFEFPTAETEIAARMRIAAERLGWRVDIVSNRAQLQRTGADFVLMTHFDAPKAGDAPAYGCMWNPPAYFENRPDRVDNVLSYDAWLTASPVIDEWVRARAAVAGRPCRTAPFYTGCHSVEFVPPRAETARLMYCGFNWDSLRCSRLFQELDAGGMLDVYGSADRWAHVANSYRGTLAFDGTAVLGALRAAGAGLCLHSPQHVQTGTASMRIFETVAAGAAAVCQEHRFIREHFGDTVHYFDAEAEPEEVHARIRDCVLRIRSRPGEAVEKARAAHEIFRRRFSFEVQLEEIGRRHAEWLASPASPSPARRAAAPVTPTVGDVRALAFGLDALRAEPDDVFVRGALKLLFERDPSRQEVADNVAALRSGMPRSVFVGRTAISAEAVLLNRSADWFRRLARHLSKPTFAGLRALWALPDASFVRGLYRLLFFREPDPAGLDSWTEGLRRGRSRAETVQLLALSPEGRLRCGRPAWLGRLTELEERHGRPVAPGTAAWMWLDRYIRGLYYTLTGY
jgi:hypothetical protein